MAISQRDIIITWENNGTFRMKVRKDGGDWNTVAEIDENNYFDKIWEVGIKPACIQFFNDEIDKIGAEMKA